MIALAVLVALLAEALLASAFAHWVGTDYREGRQVFPLGAFLAVALAGLLTPWLLARFELSRRAQVLGVAVVGYAVVYGSLRFVFAGDMALWDLSWVADFLADAEGTAARGADAFVAALLAAALWARALSRGTSEVDLETFPRTVVPAIALATAVAAVAAATTAADTVAAHSFAAVVAGAGAMTLAQLARSGATFGQLRAGTFAGTLLGLVVMAVIVAVAVFGVVYRLVAPALGDALLEAMVTLLTWVLTPVVWIVDRLMALIRSEGSQFAPPSELARGVLGGDEVAAERGGPWTVFEYLGRAMLLFVVLSMFVALGLGAFRFWHRRQGHRPTNAEVERVGTLAADLRGAWRRLLARPERPTGKRPHPIVALYLRMLDIAALGGLVRTPGATPSELRRPLHETIGDPVTDRITDALEEYRYGGRPPADATLQLLGGEWRRAEERLERTLRRAR